MTHIQNNDCEKNKYGFLHLKEPIPITKQNWPKDTKPLVTTRTFTYNHESYIRDCIEGILMQKTTFPVQVLIHDDASTDRTPEIIKEYVAKYPEFITLFEQPENCYSKPEKYELRKPFYELAKGKYVALCEGDDYWIDPLKLQKQVTYLEKNKKYVITYHDSIVINEEGEVLKNSKLSSKYKRDATAVDLLKGFHVLTQTMCFRNIKLIYPEESKIAFGGDKFLTSLIGAYGAGKYMEDIKNSCFRVHRGGVNRGVTDHKLRKINHLKTRIALFLYYQRIGNDEIRDHYIAEINRVSNDINDQEKKGKLLKFFKSIFTKKI